MCYLSHFVDHEFRQHSRYGLSLHHSIWGKLEEAKIKSWNHQNLLSPNPEIDSGCYLGLVKNCEGSEIVLGCVQALVWMIAEDTRLPSQRQESLLLRT